MRERGCGLVTIELFLVIWLWLSLGLMTLSVVSSRAKESRRGDLAIFAGLAIVSPLWVLPALLFGFAVGVMSD